MLDIRMHALHLHLHVACILCPPPPPRGEPVRLTCTACLQFGRIVSVDLKSPAVPPPFAFVEFDHPRCGAAAEARQGPGRTPGPPGLHELGQRLLHCIWSGLPCSARS